MDCLSAPPRILKKLFDFTGLTNRELKLTVEVSASPKPIVHWYVSVPYSKTNYFYQEFFILTTCGTYYRYKNGLFLKPSSRVKYVVDESTDSYTLAIDNAVMDDAGTYSVVASNEYSQDSDACHVNMESPPQFLAAIAQEVETVEGDYVSFSVLVDGDPLPDVKW